MKKIVRLAAGCVAAVLVTAASACSLFELKPTALTIVKDGMTDFVIVQGQKNIYDDFAVSEFKEIMLASTGVDFKVVDSGSKEASAAEYRIHIGDSPIVRSLLGEDTVKNLKKQESIVASRGDNLILVGEGREGTSYAVYSFLEKEIGFRHFTPTPNGINIPKHATVKYSGLEYREHPAFSFNRTVMMTYLYGAESSLWQFRNRGSISQHVNKTKMKGMSPECAYKDSGHGFNLYITTKGRENFYPWDEPKDYFQTNPDFFSMNKEGQRTTNLQVCFSNPALRKELTKRVLERCRRVGGSGVLTLGANDWPGSFCYCSDCLGKEKKYGCKAGPFYDYLLELCPQVAKEYPKIMIASLAYRKEQSEKPPVNIEKMPANWICDFAPVDDDQFDYLDGKRNLGTLENLKNWNKITPNITYWFYSCITSAPFGLIDRTQHDIKLMRENHVMGGGICGLATPGTFPMQEYLFLRLMNDPDQNISDEVKNYTDFMYGDAAPEMRVYLADLEALWKEHSMYVGLDGNDLYRVFTPERLVRWQKLFDSMTLKVAGKEREAKNLALTRNDVDYLCLQYYSNIKSAYPNWEVTPEQLIERGRKAGVPRYYKYYMRDMENNYLVVKASKKPIPAPLDKIPANQVHQIVTCGGFSNVVDPDAAAGAAMLQTFHDGYFKNGKTMSFDLYDVAEKKNNKAGKFDISDAVANQYKLYYVGKGKITRSGIIALGNWYCSAALGQYYPEGDEHREFEFWASLKFTGPEFDKDSKDKKSKMYCDRIFVIDRAVEKK